MFEQIRALKRVKDAQIITTESRAYAIQLVSRPEDFAAKVLIFEALQKQTGYFGVFGLCKITSNHKMDKVLPVLCSKLITADNGSYRLKYGLVWVYSSNNCNAL